LHGEKIYLEGNKVRPEQAAEMYFQYLIVMPHATTASSVRIHKTKFDTFGLFSPAMLCKVCSPVIQRNFTNYQQCSKCKEGLKGVTINKKKGSFSSF